MVDRNTAVNEVEKLVTENKMMQTKIKRNLDTIMELGFKIAQEIVGVEPGDRVISIKGMVGGSNKPTLWVVKTVKFCWHNWWIDIKYGREPSIELVVRRILDRDGSESEREDTLVNEKWVKVENGDMAAAIEKLRPHFRKYRRW